MHQSGRQQKKKEKKAKRREYESAFALRQALNFPQVKQKVVLSAAWWMALHTAQP